MKRDLVWKGAATAASIGAGMAARNAASSVWKRRQGQDPPVNPADPATSWKEAIAWTLLVGALVGFARLVARRWAAAAWEAVEGEVPPGLQDMEA